MFCNGACFIVTLILHALCLMFLSNAAPLQESASYKKGEGSPKKGAAKPAAKKSKPAAPQEEDDDDDEEDEEDEESD